MQENEFFEIFTHRMLMRWADMDAYGHVNNAVYFRYMEQTRIDWLESVGMAAPQDGCGPVIIDASMTFLRQLRYPGELICRLLAGPMGRSSLATGFELYRADTPDVCVARGAAKIVWVNYAQGKSIPLPDALRQLIDAARTGNARAS